MIEGLKVKMLCFLLGLIISVNPTGSVCAEEFYNPVAVVQLVVHPEDFVDKQVKIRGFLRPGAELAIFPTYASAILRDHPSSIIVGDSNYDGAISDSCAAKYVMIRGTFRKFGSLYKIVDIVKVNMVEEKMRACWPEEKELENR